MLRSFRIVWACLAVLFIAACDRDRLTPPPPPASTEEPDFLPEEIIEGLDPLPSHPESEHTIILPNGLSAASFLALVGAGELRPDDDFGPQDAKNYLIAKMAVEALRLTNRVSWVRPSEGSDRPAQPNGLAYVYGGKDTSKRRKSATGCCPELFGLDCSGFVKLVLGAGGVTIPEGPAASQATADLLTSALGANDRYKRLYAEDLGVLALEDMETGDILTWMDGGGIVRHIGIVLNDQIYQSNGSAGVANGSCSSEECDRNFGPTRGPRPIALSQAITFFASSGYQLRGVVRIMAHVSGDWRLYMRCTEASSDALEVDLTFPPVEDHQWTISTNFVDYDGTPLSGVFEFAYLKVDNVLTGSFEISTVECDSNPFRSEGIQVRLNRDDTGYFATTPLSRNECAGCPVAVRLVNRNQPAFQRSVAVVTEPALPPRIGLLR